MLTNQKEESIMAYMNIKQNCMELTSTIIYLFSLDFVRLKEENNITKLDFV